MTIDQTICDVRTDCEEMFFALGMDDPGTGAELTKKAMEIAYAREINVHKKYLEISQSLLKGDYPRLMKLPLEGRIKSHQEEIDILENKLQALKLI